MNLYHRLLQWLMLECPKCGAGSSSPNTKPRNVPVVIGLVGSYKDDWNYFYRHGGYPLAGLLLEGRITKSKYEKKRKEYRTEQRKINNKIAKLHFADEEYYLTSEYLLKLASRASELFESSELTEKRLLLKMTLQNLELDGKNVRFNWIKPFDTIANYASRQLWLPRLATTRTIKEWVSGFILGGEIRGLVDLSGLTF